MAMTWKICSGCSNKVGLVFDTDKEENQYRREHPYQKVAYASDFGACNLCMDFVCRECLTDYEGNSREWCTRCDRETDSIPPLTRDHPDPRRRLSPFSDILMQGYCRKDE